MKPANERRGKLIVVAHCILNQNSRVSGLAHYPAVIDEVIDVLKRHNVGFLQMPCPELTYLGVQRPSKTKEEYDTPRYRKYCKQIAISTINQIEEFAKNDTKVVAVLGIRNSPSCNVSDSAEKTGILVEELALELEKRGLRIPMKAINVSEIAADIKWLKNILRTD